MLELSSPEQGLGFFLPNLSASVPLWPIPGMLKSQP